MFVATKEFVERLNTFTLVKYWVGKNGIYELFEDELGITHKIFHKFQSTKVYCIL